MLSGLQKFGLDYLTEKRNALGARSDTTSQGLCVGGAMGWRAWSRLRLGTQRTPSDLALSRFTLSFRDVGDLLAERGIAV
jgi:hypothetical protein